MREKGTHTFDLYLRYHKCPDCGAIIESRNDYARAEGKEIKKISCPNCRHTFIVEKPAPRKGWFPLFGKASKPEFDWS